MNSWIALITSLPTENATARMRAWRSLKASGAAVLRDGVYPDLYAMSSGYTVTNISVSHKLTDWIAITAKVNNLFDRKYEPANGFQAPGIEALAGVALTF